MLMTHQNDEQWSCWLWLLMSDAPYELRWLCVFELVEHAHLIRFIETDTQILFVLGQAPKHDSSVEEDMWKSRSAMQSSWKYGETLANAMNKSPNRCFNSVFWLKYRMMNFLYAEESAAERVDCIHWSQIGCIHWSYSFSRILHIYKIKQADFQGFIKIVVLDWITIFASAPHFPDLVLWLQFPQT